MAALYDLFRTPQPKGEEKVRYHARSVVTSKMSTQDLIHTIARRNAFKEEKLTHPGHLRAPFYFPVPGNYGVSRG